MTTLTTPGGSPASAQTSAKSRADSGVRRAGLMMTVLPMASAGATARASDSSGQLDDRMTNTQPRAEVEDDDNILYTAQDEKVHRFHQHTTVQFCTVQSKDVLFASRHSLKYTKNTTLYYHATLFLFFLFIPLIILECMPGNSLLIEVKRRCIERRCMVFGY